MSLEGQLADLVTANRILAREGVVDGFGHVSVRHPDRTDRYFLSCSRSPELVSRDDLLEFDLDSNPIDLRGLAPYTERPIHGEIYKARPDVQSVIHNHADEVIPFGTTGTKLRQMIHNAGGMGSDIPVWDIHDKFGDTDMLVRTTEHGQDLAQVLGLNTTVLMRGHGCTVASRSLKETVKIAIYVMVNARLQSRAMQMGEVKFLSPGEVQATRETVLAPLTMDRAWEHWARRAGC